MAVLTSARSTDEWKRLSKKPKTKAFLESLWQKPVHTAAAVMLLLALLPWPYGYYQLLRVVICIASCIITWQVFRAKRTGWMVIMTILFNPIAPIFLTRDVWALVDIIAAIVFVACPAPVPKQQAGTG